MGFDCGLLSWLLLCGFCLGWGTDFGWLVVVWYSVVCFRLICWEVVSLLLVRFDL